MLPAASGPALLVGGGPQAHAATRRNTLETLLRNVANLWTWGSM